ncbi:MAG: 16S rRNA (cytosine(1402)-N(4))-methyltransferase RsmH [Candidatus Tantalella remota]|nr:16S rRNA (cytosine(1402)-N(4))-methyltransferase RsmH [Candidatus Tantalella remota]
MHLPVLLKKAIDHLDPEAGDIILDATLGGGGHAEAILQRIVPDGTLIGTDADTEAIERCRVYLARFGEAAVLVHKNFGKIDEVLKAVNIDKLDGALFDLGISSFQIDEADRGFSFLRDGPLDMRFDCGAQLTASEVVNRFGREKLTDILKEYGEERHAKLVAAGICVARRKQRIETTGQLKDIVMKAVGAKYRKQRLHPATRTFQALRIYVNDELSSIAKAVRDVVRYLSPGGRVCVISFHSLEDRIIKNIFREEASEGSLEIITRKPVTPDAEEIRENPRARSAKMRVAERKT